MATRVCPACRCGILKKYHGTRKIHEVKITKMAGCAEELDAVMDRTKKLKEFFGIKRVFRYNITFIDPRANALGKYHHFRKYFAEYPSLLV